MSETITPAYAEQNRHLHELRVDYGAGGAKWADAVLEIMGELELDNVLDYGCGKGDLAKALPGIPIAEYDPAVPGKDQAPEPADLVVCTDVLEHVETERHADAVLRELQRLARRGVLISVCTIPAIKNLPDGRNAHLLVRDAAWWRAQLGRYFERMAEMETPSHLTWKARPLHEIGQIRSVMAVSSEERHRQVEDNCRREPRRLAVNGREKLNGRRAVILCYGPSLIDTIVDAIQLSDEPGTDIFTVSGAHKFAIDRGLVPAAHIDCDPRRHKVTQIGEAHPDVHYWLASCVHPSYLEHVAGGRQTRLWHAYNGEDSHRHLFTVEPTAHMVVGGGSVGLRSMSLLYALGYRAFEIHGMDCSFRGEQQWAGEHHGKRKPVVNVTMPDGRKFTTSPALILYYRYFFKQRHAMLDATIELRGDGMLQNAMRLTSHAN
jgi:hypothetical protein